MKEHTGKPVAAPEHTVLMALARSVVPAARVQQAEALLQAGLDWTALVHCAEAHGVLPLLYHNLKTHLAHVVPDRVMRGLRASFHAHFQVSLQARSALPPLLARLQAHGVHAVPFKGPVLAAMAYGDQKLRPYSDLDLLVRKADVERTASILEADGFVACDPVPATLKTHGTRYVPFQPVHGNAVGYVRDDGAGPPLNLDLHWGLASHYFQVALDPDDLRTRLRPVALDDDYAVQTFSPEDTLVYLCLHGTKHNWQQLRYVCDVAELLRAHPALDWRTALRRARAVCCERMVLLGAELAHDLLDVPRPEPVAHRLGTHPIMPRLVQAARASLFAPMRLRRTLWLQVRVRDRARDAVGTCYYRLRQAVQPSRTDRAWVALPPALHFLYVLVRPLRIAAQALARQGARSDATRGR